MPGRKSDRLDIHVHTAPGSRCAAMSVYQYLTAAASLGLTAICLTNHGDMRDAAALESAAPAGLTVVAGVEISSPEGDFLIFSEDRHFLKSLKPVQHLPERFIRPRGTAVVWAHPFAGNAGGRDASEAYISGIASRVDGIEVCNGRWPDREAGLLASRIAADFKLAELGGSDAHQIDEIMRCGTSFDMEIKNAADLVAAILNRNTRASCGN